MELGQLTTGDWAEFVINDINQFPKVHYFWEGVTFEHLRSSFKRRWRTGSHLAVHETVQRFIGTAKEAVSISTKLEPEGSKP